MTPDIQNEVEIAPTLSRELPPPLEPLEELSWNYWWSWAPDGAEVFRDLDPNLWQQCEQNPRLLLAQLSNLRLAQIAADPIFVDRIEKLHERFRTYMSELRLSPKLKLSPEITMQAP